MHARLRVVHCTMRRPMRCSLAPKQLESGTPFTFLVVRIARSWVSTYRHSSAFERRFLLVQNEVLFQKTLGLC